MKKISLSEINESSQRILTRDQMKMIKGGTYPLGGRCITGAPDPGCVADPNPDDQRYCDGIPGAHMYICAQS